MSDRLDETMEYVSEKAQDAKEYANDLMGNGSSNSDFSKAANEALEYVREVLESGAELATTAFNGAVEMGKDAMESINQSTPNSSDRGPKGRTGGK